LDLGCEAWTSVAKLGLLVFRRLLWATSTARLVSFALELCFGTLLGLRQRLLHHSRVTGVPVDCAVRLACAARKKYTL
jgi:hypothetical protein